MERGLAPRELQDLNPSFSVEYAANPLFDRLK
jgi:hypothetical protein